MASHGKGIFEFPAGHDGDRSGFSPNSMIAISSHQVCRRCPICRNATLLHVSNMFFFYETVV